MGKSYEKILEDREDIRRRYLSDGTVIFTVKGDKSPEDFRVKVYNPKKGIKLQPKHAHFAIDFYGKICANKEKALKVFDAIIEVWNKNPVEEVINKYKEETNGLPGYDLEYILYTLGLILEQENINFKGRSLEKQQELDMILKSKSITTPKGCTGSELAIALFCDIANGTHPVEAFIRSGLRI